MNPEIVSDSVPPSETVIWGIAVMAKTQDAAAKKHCFGDCGKISMAGAIDDPVTGGLFVCCQASCPYEDEVILNYGKTMSFGKPHTLHLRLLKEETSALCPHGMPLAENVCGICSEGRPNA